MIVFENEQERQVWVAFMSGLLADPSARTVHECGIAADAALEEYRKRLSAVEKTP